MEVRAGNIPVHFGFAKLVFSYIFHLRFICLTYNNKSRATFQLIFGSPAVLLRKRVFSFLSNPAILPLYLGPAALRPPVTRGLPLSVYITFSY